MDNDNQPTPVTPQTPEPIVEPPAQPPTSSPESTLNVLRRQPKLVKGYLGAFVSVFVLFMLISPYFFLRSSSVPKNYIKTTAVVSRSDVRGCVENLNFTDNAGHVQVVQYNLYHYKACTTHPNGTRLAISYNPSNPAAGLRVELGRSNGLGMGIGIIVADILIIGFAIFKLLKSRG